jgi:hypothetical protein
MNRLLWCGVVACLLVPQVLCAESNLPYAVQATLISKILVYDNNSGKNSKNNVIMIGLLYNDDEKSKDVVKAMTDQFTKLKAKGIEVKSYSLDSVPVLIGANLAEDLKANNVSVAYLVDGKNADINAITSVTQSLKVLSISGDNASQWVGKGITVGLANENDKASISINLPSAMKEGRDFSAQFLSLVKIVK